MSENLLRRFKHRRLFADKWPTCHDCAFFLMGEYFQDVFYGDCLFFGRINDSDHRRCDSCFPHNSFYAVTQSDKAEVEKLIASISERIEKKYKKRRMKERKWLDSIDPEDRIHYEYPMRVEQGPFE